MTLLLPGMINIAPVRNPPKEPTPPIPGPRLPARPPEPEPSPEPVPKPLPLPLPKYPKPAKKPPVYPEQNSHSSLPAFLASIRGNDGLASPNRYDVVIIPPSVGRAGTTSKNPLFKSINDVGPNETRNVSMRCESINLPGRNLNTFDDTTIYGPRRTVVDGASFDDGVEMIFTASTDMRERVYFEKWQHAAFDQETWNVSFYKDYIGMVEIYTLNINEERMYGVRLYECFPKTIAASQLSYATTNEAMKITVSMNFRYWRTISLDDAF